MKNSKLIVSLSFFLFISLCGFSQSDPIHESISVQQADSLIKAYIDSSNFVILDVRTTEEYESGHIENAINLDYFSNEFNQNLALLNKDTVYLVYCKSGARSNATLNKMKALEFQTVYNMLGGIEAWISAGFPVVTGGDTGIWDFFAQQAQLLMYPNPVTPESKFIFTSSQVNSCQIIILNIQGQMITEFYIENGSSWSFAERYLSPGLYFYQAIINGKLFKTGKIISR